MKNKLRLLAILAHPDDESLATGSTLAKYASEEVETYLICATKGERGWMGEEKDNPGLVELGKIREQELIGAAKILGIRQVYFLGYLDGELDRADPGEAIGKIAAIIREVKPQVAITFGPDGAYGHPDHIAISQFAAGACLLAADGSHIGVESLPSHQISKFYYFANTRKLVDSYSAVFGNIQMEIDGISRSMVSWADWACTTTVDGSPHWKTALEAVNCHKSQIGIYGDLNTLSDAKSIELWGKRTYYRVFSLVNGGRKVETDLFEGIK
jgi:LmbE family N-acetylglucosaminyl deacetylase